VIVRVPINFLGPVSMQGQLTIEEFIGDPAVATAVQSILTAGTEAERVQAVNQLMENLG
jgi:hypothetical protein